MKVRKDFRNASILPQEINLWKQKFIEFIHDEFFSVNKPFLLTEENKPKISLCFDWIIGRVDKSLNKGLLLRGDVGSGKSCLLKATRSMCELLYSNLYSKYVTADEISRLYRSGDETCEKIITQIMTCKLLFIDDIGYEALKVFDHYPIPEVIRERYDKKRITCLTTNMSIDEITARYGKSFEDKLSEMCFIVKFEGESKR
jgi:DNA replication protein DnaC